jgi:hypothetical protein
MIVKRAIVAVFASPREDDKIILPGRRKWTSAPALEKAGGN